MIDPVAAAQARTLLIRLELVSHGGTQKFDSQPGRNADNSSAFPPGGIVCRDDREPDHPLKSHEHFRRRLAGAVDTTTVEAIVGEMEAALTAWTHSKAPPADSIPWKEQVARDPRKPGVIAKQYGITAQYVWQIKRQYGVRKAA